MHRLAKLTIALLIVITLLTATRNTPISAPSSTPEAAYTVASIEKQYCNATINDNFTDNELLIVVMPFANFTTYTPESFSEVGCIAVEDLMTDITANILCRILHLTLSEHSKQNVINAIGTLEEREDIYSVEPNYIQELNLEVETAYTETDNKHTFCVPCVSIAILKITGLQSQVMF